MTAFVYKRRRALDICLRLLDSAVEADTYESVLNTLGAGIRKAAGRIEGAVDEDGVIDYEIELIESMLGVAYVVCQTQITAVVQAALGVPDQAITFPNGAPDVRALGSRFDNNYSKIEVLWALANYFKHRDGWCPDTWVKPTKQEKATVDAIKAVDLSCGSSGNLRKGAEALGNASYTDVAVFYQVVRSWSTDVREHIGVKLGR